MPEHPFAYLKHRADLMKCCADTDNLVIEHPQPDVLRAVCKRCGRGHRKFLCEPGSLHFEALRSMSTLAQAKMVYGPDGQIVTIGVDGTLPTDLVVTR
jgi:hypothetical protein